MKEFLIDFDKKKLALAIRTIFHIQKWTMFPYRKMKQC